MSQQQNVGPKKGDKEEESKIYRPKKNKKIDLSTKGGHNKVPGGGRGVATKGNGKGGRDRGRRKKERRSLVF